MAAGSIVKISTIYTHITNSYALISYALISYALISHALISHTQEMTYLAVRIVVSARLAVAIHHVYVFTISTGQTSSVLLQSSSIDTEIALTVSHAIETAN